MTAGRPTSFTPTSAYSLSTLAQQATTVRSNNNSTPKVTLPSTAAKTTSHTIACIDDSPAVLQSINTFLSEENVSVIMINDPVKALMQVIRSKPDLILLDITMPNLDGYELCSLLRKHPSFRTTPVVMVTSNTGFIDRAKAKLVGASGYLTKPFTQTDLIKMIFKHLK
jgi:twitching motility two-component system response regulator PilG